MYFKATATGVSRDSVFQIIKQCNSNATLDSLKMIKFWLNVGQLLHPLNLQNKAFYLA